MLQIRSQSGQVPDVLEDRLRVAAEESWIFSTEGEGREGLLLAVAAVLPARSVDSIGGVLRVRFVNEVGLFRVPGLSKPFLEVVSGKWGEADYEAMVAEICERISSLPFSAGVGGQLPYDRSIAADPKVLYHAYIYLRHVLSPSAPRGERLLPALRVVLQDPHRRFERIRRQSAPYLCRRVDARTLRRLSNPPLERAVNPDGVLAQALAGHLPVKVDEPAIQHTYDVPENRFVKAFLEQCVAVIEAVLEAAEHVGGAFAIRTRAESEAMLRGLQPIERASLWSEVGTMTRLPAESMVLQRRQGYRDVFRHFIRLRMTTRIPFEGSGLGLLEVKDIASLYEMWCFFAMEQAVSAALGRPIQADSATTSTMQRSLGYDLTVRWEDGTVLAYNLRFSRSKGGERRSYSVPLRPDVTLRLPDGTVHVFDAKFRLRRLADAKLDEVEELTDEIMAEERRGDFKRADLYKMHTYRDALGSRTAWVLYPGDVFQFFDADMEAGRPTGAAAIRHDASGVGAIPLVPGEEASVLGEVVAGLLNSSD